jgi:Zn-finger in Ran binding protein and others
VRNFIAQCTGITPADLLETLMKREEDVSSEINAYQVQSCPLGSGELRSYYHKCLNDVIRLAEEKSAEQIAADEELARTIASKLEEEAEAERTRKRELEEKDAAMASMIAQCKGVDAVDDRRGRPFSLKHPSYCTSSQSDVSTRFSISHGKQTRAGIGGSQNTILNFVQKKPRLQFEGLSGKVDLVGPHWGEYPDPAISDSDPRCRIVQQSNELHSDHSDPDVVFENDFNGGKDALAPKDRSLSHSYMKENVYVSASFNSTSSSSTHSSSSSNSSSSRSSSSSTSRSSTPSTKSQRNYHQSAESPHSSTGDTSLCSDHYSQEVLSGLRTHSGSGRSSSSSSSSSGSSSVSKRVAGSEPIRGARNSDIRFNEAYVTTIALDGAEWGCKVCTLINPPTFLVCDACGSEKS